MMNKIQILNKIQKKEKNNPYNSKIISSKIYNINPKEKGKIKLAKNRK